MKQMLPLLCFGRNGAAAAAAVASVPELCRQWPRRRTASAVIVITTATTKAAICYTEMGVKTRAAAERMGRG